MERKRYATHGVFSSLGVLCEVLVAPAANSNPSTDKIHRDTCGGAGISDSDRISARRSLMAIKPRKVSLSEVGYAQKEDKIDAKNKLLPPIGVCFTLLETMVSERLVNKRSVRDDVLSYAANTTGLDSFIKGTSALPVPTALFGRDFDAAWITSPGRYVISPKCDDTRCLLLVDKQGNCLSKSNWYSLLVTSYCKHLHAFAGHGS